MGTLGFVVAVILIGAAVALGGWMGGLMHHSVKFISAAEMLKGQDAAAKVEGIGVQMFLAYIILAVSLLVFTITWMVWYGPTFSCQDESKPVALESDVLLTCDHGAQQAIEDHNGRLFRICRCK